MRNFDENAFETFARYALKFAASSKSSNLESATDMLKEPSSLAVLAGYGAGIVLGAGVIAAAFLAGKKHERVRLYEMH